MKETLTDIDTSTQSKNPIQIKELEKYLLENKQVGCPVLHHFGPGVYIREVFLPKGALAIGHYQKQTHLNIMLSGKVAIVENDKVKVLAAPMIFIGQPGRKMGYIIEDCAWLNVYSTDETDIEKLESMFLDKSEVWIDHEKESKTIRTALREEDRIDFIAMLEEVGVSSELVRDQSICEDDLIPFPEGYNSYVSVRDSDIEGNGMFLSCPVSKKTMIVPARIEGNRTPAGRYVNHSKSPNCEFIKEDNGDIYLVSLRDIHGCQGGSHGEELTVDYRQALSVHEGEQCQG